MNDDAKLTLPDCEYNEPLGECVRRSRDPDDRGGKSRSIGAITF